MLHVVLYEPEIPPNTGNIIRICAITGVVLHLIEPLGFEIDDKRLRRAGLDYAEFAELNVHKSLSDCQKALIGVPFYAFSTRGSDSPFDLEFPSDVAMLFGPETRGLPQEILDSLPDERLMRLPMLPQRRSLNLANTVAISVYEAWRQRGFEPW